MGISNLWIWGENSVPRPNYMEDTLERLLDWQECSILAPQGSHCKQGQGNCHPAKVIHLCYCLSGQGCVPNPISLVFFRQRQTVTNPLSLLCSSCRKLGFFPLFSTWSKNCSFGVNAAYCPTCFFEEIQSQPFFSLSESQGNQVDSHLLWLSFLNTSE